MRAAAALVTVAAALLALAPPVLSAAPGAELSEIEGEVMCTICGTLLELSDSPQAQRERVFISKLISAGETRSQIKDALVAQYGPRVLASPQGSGFNLSAYLVPAIAFLIAVVALATAVLRWRRAASRDNAPPRAASPSADQEERLDADLARYDL